MKGLGKIARIAAVALASLLCVACFSTFAFATTERDGDVTKNWSFDQPDSIIYTTFEKGTSSKSVMLDFTPATSGYYHLSWNEDPEVYVSCSGTLTEADPFAALTSYYRNTTDSEYLKAGQKYYWVFKLKTYEDNFSGLYQGFKLVQDDVRIRPSITAISASPAVISQGSNLDITVTFNQNVEGLFATGANTADVDVDLFVDKFGSTKDFYTGYTSVALRSSWDSGHGSVTTYVSGNTVRIHYTNVTGFKYKSKALVDNVGLQLTSDAASAKFVSAMGETPQNFYGAFSRYEFGYERPYPILSINDVGGRLPKNFIFNVSGPCYHNDPYLYWWDHFSEPTRRGDRCGACGAEKDVEKLIVSSKKTYVITGSNTVTLDEVPTSASGTVTIPNTIKSNGKTYKVTKVGYMAFDGCKKVKKVVLGKSIKKLEAYAFMNCSNLAKVDASKAKYLEGVGDRVFQYCKKLTTFDLSKNKKLSYFGSDSFIGCKKLKTLKIGSKKLTKNGVLEGLRGSSIKTVKVPKAKLKTYKKYFTKANCGVKVKLYAL